MIILMGCDNGFIFFTFFYFSFFHCLPKYTNIHSYFRLCIIVSFSGTDMQSHFAGAEHLRQDNDTNGIAYVNFNRQWINYFFAGASLIIFESFVYSSLSD
jgi:hypothetical protein